MTNAKEWFVPAPVLYTDQGTFQDTRATQRDTGGSCGFHKKEGQDRAGRHRIGWFGSCRWPLEYRAVSGGLVPCHGLDRADGTWAECEPTV